MHTKDVFGIYGEDFLQYGTFLSEGDPMNDEKFLLEITNDSSPHIGERISFWYDTDKIHFKVDINPENVNPEICHWIEES